MLCHACLRQADLPVDYEKAAQRYLKASEAKHAEVRALGRHGEAREKKRMTRGHNNARKEERRTASSPYTYLVLFVCLGFFITRYYVPSLLGSQVIAHHGRRLISWIGALVTRYSVGDGNGFYGEEDDDNNTLAICIS